MDRFVRLGKYLAQEAVGVLVGAALPVAGGAGEIHALAQQRHDLVVISHF